MPTTVLVVDDQPSLRQMVRFALQFQGLRVIEAADGVEALAQLSRHPVNLVITDWKMPNMDGLELVQQVRGMLQFAELPILMVSCVTDPAAEQASLDQGVLGWLKKPFRMKEIQAIVLSALVSNPPVTALSALDGRCG